MVIEMNVNSIKWDLFYMDRPSSKASSYTVLRAKLDKALPDLILDSLSTQGYLSIPTTWQMVELEGDFYKKFKLHIPKDSQINALSLITPDIMRLLDLYNRSGDIELTGGYIFVIYDEDSRDGKTLEKMITSASLIYKKLNS